MFGNVFQTNNTALAVTLATAGVPVPRDERGRPNAQAMIYSVAMLKRMGYAGMTADQAAQMALRDRRPGIRLFFFQANEISPKVVMGFEQAHVFMEAGQNIYIEDVEPEHIGSIGYAQSRMRRHMLSAFDIPAFLTSDEGVKGEKTVDGGWKASGTLSAISVGASGKLKSEIRL